MKSPQTRKHHSLGWITRQKKSSIFFYLEQNIFCPCNLSHIMVFMLSLLYFWNNPRLKKGMQLNLDINEDI